MINTYELKQKAKFIDRTSAPSVFLVGLVYFLILAVLTYLSSSLMTTGVTESDLNKASEYIVNGQYYAATEFLQKFRPPASGSIVSTLIDIVTRILEAGFVIFIINSVRSNAPCFGNLLDGFNIFVRVIILNLLMGIFIFLWSLLLIVPGIIAAYKYRLALFLLIDHPEMSCMQCILKSKEMMSGHKGELFSLDLSMLGWYILAALLPPVDIYVTPYTKTVYTLYYQQLAGILDKTDFEPTYQ